MSAALLVVIYFSLPLQGHVGSHAVALLSVLLVVFVLVLVWQVRAITDSRKPVLRAIEALAFLLPLFLLSFALAYFLMARYGVNEFNSPLTRTDSLYFSTTVFATVGFGDIVPTSESARLVVTAQMLIDLILLGVGLRVILEAVQVGRRRAGSGESSV